MTVAFHNLAPLLAYETENLKKKDRAGFHAWMDLDHEVNVVMKRIAIDNDIPNLAQRSAYKKVRDIAIVTITPPNQELANIVTKYFLSEKIEASMGMPERLFFDEVTLNGQSII